MEHVGDYLEMTTEESNHCESAIYCTKRGMEQSSSQIYGEINL